MNVKRDGEPGPGRAISITMRTPGNDIEFAVGFLPGEGLIHSQHDIASARICAERSAQRSPALPSA